MSLLEYIAKLLINNPKLSFPWSIVFKTVFTGLIFVTDLLEPCSRMLKL